MSRGPEVQKYSNTSLVVNSILGFRYNNVVLYPLKIGLCCTELANVSIFEDFGFYF